MTNRPRSNVDDDSRYRMLVEAVTDYAIYMLDPAGIVSSWNAGAQRFKGYAASEIIGEHFARFYTKEDQGAGLPAKALATAAREGRFESEGWRVRKDGTLFWASVVVDPIRSETGELMGFAKVTRDLTQRKATEATLRRSEEQFRLLVQGVTDYAIYMLDTEGHVNSWNAGAQRIKGYMPAEIIGQHFSRFYTAEDRDNGDPQRALETAVREGSFEKEGWRVRKDGSRFWAHVVLDPVRDDSGAIVGFAKVTRDITERRNAEAALDLARDALFQSQKMDAIGQLTGGIAHDFNNLLMAILSSLELVRKRLPDDPVVTALLDNAVQGAQRGSALTQRMLAFARRQTLTSEVIDLPTLVSGMTELLQRSLGPLVTIETRFPLGLRSVHADANQFELAILNLAVNARDAMPDGGTLILAGREEAISSGDKGALKPGAYICFSAIDTGMGMDESTLARAIEPFFTTKGIGKGTGLGLSMVHGLAEQSGGRLLLKSRLREGTTAELWLPVAEQASDASGKSAVESNDDSNRYAQLLTIVVVDDDDLVRVNMAMLLEDLGHRTFAAASGNEALDVLRREKNVDLVITDQAMPKMLGSQLAAMIEKEWPGLPVVIATGYAELPPGVDAKQRKLAKPFTQADLVRVIAEVARSSPS